MIRLLHAADLHLDSPFSALSPEQSAQRREEQRDLLRRLTEECQRRDCALLLLSGDLFDSGEVYQETAELLRETLSGLRARVFIAPGNHDPWSPSSPYATLQWPENVHIFSARTPEAVRLEEPRVTVWGAAFTDARDTGLLTDLQPLPAEDPSVFVVHGVLGDPNSPYNPITEAQVRSLGVNYLALGHIHKQAVQVIGQTTVGNPGCPMGRGFDETGPKGVLCVELEGAECRVEPVDLGARRYEILTVPVREDPTAEVLAALPPDAARDIYRIILTGSCPTPDLSALREALAGKVYALELTDRTQPPLQIWEKLGENSLKGEFLRQLKGVYDQAQDEAGRQIVAQAASLGLALMERREVPEL